MAAKQGHSEVLQKIMETGENIDERNIVSLAPIVRAFWFEVIYLLHIVIFHQDGMTALHLAAEGGHYECIRLLLEAGCNVNELTHVSTMFYFICSLHHN